MINRTFYLGSRIGFRIKFSKELSIQEHTELSSQFNLVHVNHATYYFTLDIDDDMSSMDFETLQQIQDQLSLTTLHHIQNISDTIDAIKETRLYIIKKEKCYLRGYNLFFSHDIYDIESKSEIREESLGSISHYQHPHLYETEYDHIFADSDLKIFLKNWHLSIPINSLCLL